MGFLERARRRKESFAGDTNFGSMVQLLYAWFDVFDLRFRFWAEYSHDLESMEAWGSRKMDPANGRGAAAKLAVWYPYF